jgi:hypothetical protein
MIAMEVIESDSNNALTFDPAQLKDATVSVAADNSWRGR